MKPANPLTRCFTAFVFLLSIAAAQAQQPRAFGRQVISLNDQWTFSNDSVAKTPAADWQNINLPHTWNTTDVLDDIIGYYRGGATYKRKLIIPDNMRDKYITLRFNGVGQQCEVFINGRSAGKHIGGYNRFILPVSPYLNPNGENEITVKASNVYSADIPPLSGDFTQFGGIYRSVDLIATAPVHFSQKDMGGPGVYITTPQVNANAATAEVRTLLENTTNTAQKVHLNLELRNAENEIVADISVNYTLSSGAVQTVTNKFKPVTNPHLWSTADPYLYTIVAELSAQKTSELLDRTIHPFGFRWFSFDAAKGFFLNGKSLKLIGASRHQDYEGMGNAVPEALQVRDVTLLKEMGGNFLRVAHYPQDQAVLDACDRLGILASVETPIVNTITESPGFTANSVMMQQEMIRQNFNHPSIVLWAYMNEVLLQPLYRSDTTRQKAYFQSIKTLAQTLEDLTRKEDPSRYTLMANHGAFDSYHKLGLTRIPMVVGWNLYSGWYGGTVKDFAKALERHRRDLPDKPLLVTEYGADADPRIRAENPEKFDKSIEYAILYHQQYLKDIFERPYVSGAMAWNLSDFSSEFRSESMPHINNKGLMTIGRVPKDTYWLYKAWLTAKPMVKIGSNGWTIRAGVNNASGVSAQTIKVFTNAAAVELFLNGRSLGRQATSDAAATFNVPFINGNNQLVAVAEGATDVQDIWFDSVPDVFKDAASAAVNMNILLGSRRYFYDEQREQVWIPDQPYKAGSWGYIGGNILKVAGTLPPYGSAKNVLTTLEDPVYQTQQEDIKAYRADVLDGNYQVALHFAELTGGQLRKVVNDLSDGSAKQDVETRVFDVLINGVKMLSGFDPGENGAVTAVKKEFTITVADGKGINIDFVPVKGKPVLNAIQIKKI